MKPSTSSVSIWTKRIGKFVVCLFAAVLLAAGCSRKSKPDSNQPQAIATAPPTQTPQPSPTLKIEEERQSFRDYIVINRWDPNAFEGRLKVTKGGQTILDRQGGKFYVGSAISEDNERQKPQPIAIGKDITGEGKPNLVVMEWSGGAHCCSDYYVFELGESIREIAKITTGNPSGHFKDLDGDSRLEFITLDDTFAYWNTSYVDSPMPQVILTFYDGAYHIAAKLMWKPAPSRAQLSRLANRLRSQNQVVPGFFNSSELWGTMLNLIYTGHGDLAEQFFETAWNHKTQGKKEFYKEFQAQLRQSQYWPEIREMNSSSRK